MARQQQAREVLLNVGPTPADIRVAEQLGIPTRVMHANIDPSQFTPVAEVSAPAFSGPAHRLINEQQNLTGQNTEHTGSASSQVMPKAKAAPQSLLRPQQPFSQYTSWTCHDPLQEYTPDGPTEM
eukprot:1380051-Amphidinium_carterae.1